MELTEIVQVVSGLGASGVLLLVVFAFYRGDVLSRKIVDEIKDHSETQTKLLATELSEKITAGTEKAVKEGVKDGVIAAVEHINGQNSGG